MDAPEMTVASESPTVRSITTGDIHEALELGWKDFKAEPRFGLFFGGIYAAAGILILLELMIRDQPLWILPLAFAFPLIGPFAAIGLYEVSRRRENGEPLIWSEIIEVVWKQKNAQMPSMAFVVLAVFLVWAWIAHILVAVFLGRMSFAVYSDLGLLLTTGNGLLLLGIGTVVGGAIALILFAITAVSLPLLLDREMDFVTAMVTSVNAVRTNPIPMLTWGIVIAGALIVAMIPFFLGLIVVLPVLGHATWHVYRKVLSFDSAGA